MKDETATRKKRKPLGRPRQNPEEVRSNRVVTFVTNSELSKLLHVTEKENISLSSVVHRVLSKYLSEENHIFLLTGDKCGTEKEQPY